MGGDGRAPPVAPGSSIQQRCGSALSVSRPPLHCRTSAATLCCMSLWPLRRSCGMATLVATLPRPGWTLVLSQGALRRCWRLPGYVACELPCFCAPLRCTNSHCSRPAMLLQPEELERAAAARGSGRGSTAVQDLPDFDSPGRGGAEGQPVPETRAERYRLRTGARRQGARKPHELAFGSVGLCRAAAGF